MQPDDTSKSRPGRRELLKTGVALVPTIFTLTATPAWAAQDYTLTAYRYGDNAGRCKNPHFNPRANPNSHAGQEFIDCPGGRRFGNRRDG